MSAAKSAVLAVALFFFAACAQPDRGPVRIVLNTTAERPTIDVVGVAEAQIESLQATASRDAWASVFRVAVAPDQPAMLGDYRIEGGHLRFTPMFPLDPGRPYHVTF